MEMDLIIQFFGHNGLHPFIRMAFSQAHSVMFFKSPSGWLFIKHAVRFFSATQWWTFYRDCSARSAVRIVVMDAENLFSGSHAGKHDHRVQPLDQSFFLFF